MRYLKEYNDWGYHQCSSFDVNDIVEVGNRLTRREYDILLDKYYGNISFYSKSDSSGIYANYVEEYNSDIARVIINKGGKSRNHVEVYKGGDDWFFVRVYIQGGLYYDISHYKCDQLEGLIKLIEDKL